MHSIAFFKKHWFVILATIAVAAFTALPSFFFFQRVGDEFRGVYPVFNGDSLYYHARVVGIGGLIGLPYFMRVLQAMDMPSYYETSVRLGMYFTHLPESYPKLAVALVWLAFFVWFSRHFRIEQERKTHLVATLLIANVLYPNHQLITGITIQNAVHWIWMPIFIFAVSGHYVLSVVRRKSPTLQNISVFLVTSLLLVVPAWRLSTFTWQPYTYLYRPNISEERQYYADVFAWINEHAEKDAVILADEQLMKYVPAYTHANVYQTQYGYGLPASNVEVIERYVLAHFFEPGFFERDDLGINEDGRILWAFPHEAEKNTHTIAGRWSIPYDAQYRLAQEQQKVREVYESLASEVWDISLLKKYRIDYVIWDTKESPEWNIDERDALEEIARIGDVVIYGFAS